jgi:hypothetical protein
MDFLDDAYHKGVLRQVGARYEFRHARLEEYFAVLADYDSPARSWRFGLWLGQVFTRR